MKPVKIDRSQASRVEAGVEGEAYLQRLVGANQHSEVEVLAVFFSAGARTRPHTHEHDQVLQVLSGTAVVGTETERHFLAPGEVIHIPAGAWHWHGATPEAAMCHIATQRPGFMNMDVDERDWTE